MNMHPNDADVHFMKQQIDANNERIDALTDHLRTMLDLMARHSWLTRDQPKIAAARAALKEAPRARSTC